MRDPSGQGFEVTPARIVGGSARERRWRRLPLAVVGIVAIAIPVVAIVGPRFEARLDLTGLLPSPTPIPSPTPRPTPAGTQPPATPFPAVTFGEGPLPDRPLEIDIGGIRLIDPQTGRVGRPSALRVDEDAIFRTTDGGWWCICFDRAAAVDEEVVEVALREVNREGRETRSRPLGEYRSSAPLPDADFGARFDLERAPDEQTAWLASGLRDGQRWTLAIEAVDLTAGLVVGRWPLAALDLQPSPSPTGSPAPDAVETYLSGPSIRLSPDGRQLLAWAWIERWSNTTGESDVEPRAWLLDLSAAPADGVAPAAGPVGGQLAAAIRTCGWVAWLDADELVVVCMSGEATSDGQQSVIVRLFGLDGVMQGEVSLLAAGESWFGEPVIDRANRLAYLWQPTAHVIHRVDLRSGRSDRLEVDPAAPEIGLDGGGARQSARPSWARATSDMRLWYGPQVLAEPGGTRLFALGLIQPDPNAARGAFGSSGVWIFDTDGFRLADQWAPAAAYGSIALSRDGRWLTAVGMPGADAQGRPADWGYSLSILDADTGRIALRIGDVADETAAVMQVPP